MEKRDSGRPRQKQSLVYNEQGIGPVASPGAVSVCARPERCSGLKRGWIPGRGRFLAFSEIVHPFRVADKAMLLLLFHLCEIREHFFGAWVVDNGRRALIEIY